MRGVGIFFWMRTEEEVEMDSEKLHDLHLAVSEAYFEQLVAGGINISMLGLTSCCCRWIMCIVQSWYNYHLSEISCDLWQGLTNGSTAEVD